MQFKAETGFIQYLSAAAPVACLDFYGKLYFTHMNTAVAACTHPRAAKSCDKHSSRLCCNTTDVTHWNWYVCILTCKQNSVSALIVLNKIHEILHKKIAAQRPTATKAICSFQPLPQECHGLWESQNRPSHPVISSCFHCNILWRRMRWSLNIPPLNP